MSCVLVHPEPSVGGLARFRADTGPDTVDLRKAMVATPAHATFFPTYRAAPVARVRGLAILGQVSHARLFAELGPSP